MDIFRVLSRGTKKPVGSAGNNPASAALNIPSAGTRPNPQLFHDPVGASTRGTKRKRKGADDGEDEAPDEAPADGDSELSSELDFFAPKDHHQSNASQGSSRQAKAAPADEKKSRPEKAKATAQLLDEDECRQLLRSHRLKLTLLSARQLQEKESKVTKKKSKKKDKKGKAGDGVKEDKKQQQLYPQPLTSFAQLRSVYAISPRLAENLDRLHYRIPTEVQMASLPLLLDAELALRNAADNGEGLATVSGAGGVDFMAVAPTGSGKTLSFLVPAINAIMRWRSQEAGSREAAGEGGRQKQHELNAVVVAPTRELATQIADEGKKLAAGTGVRIVAMKKGMRVMAEAVDDGDDGGSRGERGDADDSDSFQSDSEEGDDDDEEGDEATKTSTAKMSSAATLTKADILVTTPMLLVNYLTGGPEGKKKGSKKILPTVRFLVLDEADVLLDPLFREQTLGIWSACTNRDLHATFWSATMGSSIETLVADQMAARARQTEHDAAPPPPSRPLVRLVVGLKDTAVPNITHRLIYTATEPGKLLALRQLLRPAAGTTSQAARARADDPTGPPLRPPFLVFTQTVERASALHDELKYDIPPEAGGPARVAVLHAALPDAARAAIMRRFRAGEVWVLITTDVLARGVDFAGVNGVVNYDVPGSAAAYVHRAGRTGRAGREGGVAVTLYTRDDIPFVKSVANVIAASERQAGRGQQQQSSSEAGGGSGGGVQKWLLDALPDVSKADKKRLKARGVESRRSSGGALSSAAEGKGKAKAKAKARITSKSAWERRRENNRRGAIEASKRRKVQQGEGDGDGGSDDGWGGIED